MNKYLKLMTESVFKDIEILIEQDNKHSSKAVKIRGPYIVAEKKNGNGRIYPADIIEESVKTYDELFIKTNRAVGELNHPTTIDIDYNNVCHKITKLERNDNIWIGESNVLVGTPKGDILAALLINGVQVGISTRGVGNITDDKVVDEYKLITADIVYEPSAPGAFMEGILESKNYLINEHGDIVEVAYNKLENSINKLPLNIEERRLKIVSGLSEFLRSI